MKTKMPFRKWNNLSYPNYEVEIQAITDSNLDCDGMLKSFFLFQTTITYKDKIVWELIFEDHPEDFEILDIIKKLERERKINLLFGA